MTLVRQLRHNGAVVYRGDEQHQELDLTRKAAGSATNELVRTGAAIVAGDRTCTFDESSAVAGTATAAARPRMSVRRPMRTPAGG